jgi:hypothetical protein
MFNELLESRVISPEHENLSDEEIEKSPLDVQIVHQDGTKAVYRINTERATDFFKEHINLSYVRFSKNEIISYRYSERHRLFRGAPIKFLEQYLREGIKIHEYSSTSAVSGKPSIGLAASPILAYRYSSNTITTVGDKEHRINKSANFPGPGFIVDIDTTKINNLTKHPTTTKDSVGVMIGHERYGIATEYVTDHDIPPEAIKHVYIADYWWKNLPEESRKKLSRDFGGKLIIWSEEGTQILKGQHYLMGDTSFRHHGEIGLYHAVSGRDKIERSDDDLMHQYYMEKRRLSDEKTKKSQEAMAVKKDYIQGVGELFEHYDKESSSNHYIKSSDSSLKTAIPYKERKKLAQLVTIIVLIGFSSFFIYTLSGSSSSTTSFFILTPFLGITSTFIIVLFVVLLWLLSKI